MSWIWLSFVITGLGIGAVYALAAVGLVLLYRTTGVLNFALGAIGACAAFTTFELHQLGSGLLLACVAGVSVSTLLSGAYGHWIAPRLAYRDTMTRSLGTLGFALVLLGIVGWIWGEAPRRLQFPTDKMYIEVFKVRLTYTRLLALALALVAVAGLSVLIAKTRLGLQMRALADQRDLSALLGVSVRKVEGFAWLMVGVFAGVAGLLLANLVGLKATALTFLVIPAIAAALVAGLHSLVGAAVAGVLIGVIEAVLSLFPALAPFRSASPFLIALLAIAMIALVPRWRGSYAQ